MAEFLLGSRVRLKIGSEILSLRLSFWTATNRYKLSVLFNILAERHGQRSTVITSNLAFGEWVQVFGDEKLTTALLDRLGHRSHILTTKGPSYRTKRPTKEGSSQTASE